MVRLVALAGGDMKALTAISIPVWCDWWCIWSTFASSKPYFNSSMVRLVVFALVFKEPGKPYFNSSMVRLVATGLVDLDRSTKFQFQYGAIGGETEDDPLELRTEFQFQYGAIGGPVRMPTKQAVRYFNSSMVRLVV